MHSSSVVIQSFGTACAPGKVPDHTVAAAAHIAVEAAHTAIAALDNSPEVADLVVAHTIVAAGWDHSS